MNQTSVRCGVQSREIVARVANLSLALEEIEMRLRELGAS
jgi:hypothetical protein